MCSQICTPHNVCTLLCVHILALTHTLTDTHTHPLCPPATQSSFSKLSPAVPSTSGTLLVETGSVLSLGTSHHPTGQLWGTQPLPGWSPYLSLVGESGGDTDRPCRPEAARPMGGVLLAGNMRQVGFSLSKAWRLESSGCAQDWGTGKGARLWLAQPSTSFQIASVGIRDLASPPTS